MVTRTETDAKILQEISALIDAYRAALASVDWFYEYAEGRQYYQGREKMARAERLRDDLMAIPAARFEAVQMWNEAAPEGKRIG